jgi:hypothetical protein
VSEPPQIQIMMPQPPTPEQLALHEQEHLLMDEIRRQIVRFTAVNCACRHQPRWAFGEPPPDPAQVSCMVHGAIYFDQEGRLV